MAPALAQVIVTTTVFEDGPTSSVSPVDNANEIPVGAIAGGTAGGAFLAFFLVFVWIMWGKKIKHHELKQQKELNTLRITNKNTMMNASKLSRPRIPHLAPVFWVPDSTKVQFADNVKGGKARDPAKTPADLPEPKPSLPKALRPARSSPDADQPKSRAPPLRTKKPSLPNLPSLLQLNRKPSATSSTDPNENASPGGQMGDYASNFEDLGTRNQGDTQRLSWTHFLRSSRGRTIVGTALSSRTSRTSQATSGSAYSQPDDPSTVVGVAL
ncbi:uncharacterized protein BT62DRAFT_1070494 [Guyanagaster necrorhizus]|uniref:Uncharacterized protein n=1 Tax=Guyanagaster necrorhizus TaxID=856835 RepID=A0A9P7W7K6_9AGAR|nr:uncharacterized protein BT62DRAFT_1070494 [Guyanagaster necrorhizus MCA 3950]KAG7452771.1 hypothetical protein BT62DRAFT_1070494 [Guyanagaster necrorhizus MCA 3950]